MRLGAAQLIAHAATGIEGGEARGLQAGDDGPGGRFEGDWHEVTVAAISREGEGRRLIPQKALQPASG